MPIARYLGALGLALGGCAPNPQPSPNWEEPPHAAANLTRDSIAAVTLTRGIGGWGNGANYSISVRRDGIAHYHGGLRAVRLGEFKSLVNSVIVDSALRLVTVPGYLRVTDDVDQCADAEPATISILKRTGSEAQFAAGCGAPETNGHLAAALDSLFRNLSWESAP